MADSKPGMGATLDLAVRLAAFLALESRVSAGPALIADRSARFDGNGVRESGTVQATLRTHLNDGGTRDGALPGRAFSPVPYLTRHALTTGANSTPAGFLRTSQRRRHLWHLFP